MSKVKGQQGKNATSALHGERYSTTEGEGGEALTQWNKAPRLHSLGGRRSLPSYLWVTDQLRAMLETEVATLNEQLRQDLPSTAENGTTGLAGSCWQPERQEQDSKVRSLALAFQSILQVSTRAPACLANRVCFVTLTTF